MRSKFTWMLTLFMAFALQFSFAQEKTITGTVTDQDGLPLPGASVLVKGTVKGTQTDFNGNYSIVASTGETLVYTFIGQKSEERTVGASSVIDVQLVEDAQALEEVVVMGYSTKGKNEITGSTVQLEAEAINEMPTVTVDQALQGRVAGLNIAASSGTPGATQDIRIRGVGSITASNQPLIVIDGVPVINSDFSGNSGVLSSLSSLAAINNQDVESITVLKDASATSAYGARGSNGVIVITTKKGSQGKTSFNFTSTYGFQDFAVEQPTPLTAAQREELLYDAMFNSFGDAFGFTRDEAPGLAGALYGGSFAPVQQWIDAGRPEGNWGEEVKRDNPIIQNVNISASGGDERSTFYASLGYNKTEAVVVGSEFERINGTFNYSRKLTDKLRFTTNMNVSNTNQNAFLEQSAYFANPFLSRYFMPPTEQPYNADGTINTDLNTTVFNTLYLAENDIYENDLTRAIVNSSLEYEIIPNLTFKTRFSIDYNLSSYLGYQNRKHGGSLLQNGSSEQSVNRNFNWVTQNSLNYNFAIDQHNFDVTLLQEYQKNKSNYVYAYGENFPADGLFYVRNASANFAVDGTFSDWANASYLGLLNYNYAGKYIFDATFRREGSSRFSPGNRFGNFWSVGAAWNVSSEEFFNVDFINLLRLRGSFGVSGNSGIGINQYQALLAYSADYDAQGAAFPSGFGNDNLTWEKNENFDIGADFGLFNGVVDGSVAYFRRRTYDLLQDVPLSRTTGFNSIATNVGEMINQGVEVEANFNVIRSSDMNWSLFANFANIENEVTKLATDPEGNEINITTGTRRIETGRPIYTWYMRKWAGVDPDTGAPLWYINGQDGETTSDYNQAEVNYQGENATPTWSGGFGTHFDFKGFFVDANFYFAGGHKVYEDWAFYTKSNGLYTTLFFNGTDELLDAWKQPGDITDVPRMNGASATGDRASSTSSRFLYEGDYLRLRELAVGYNLPSSAVEMIGLDGVTFSLRALNMLTWVKDDRLKYDPEVRADGFTRLTTPPTKSFVFGVNLKF